MVPCGHGARRRGHEARGRLKGVLLVVSAYAHHNPQPSIDGEGAGRFTRVDGEVVVQIQEGGDVDGALDRLGRVGERLVNVLGG